MHVLSDHFEWDAEHIPVVLRDCYVLTQFIVMFLHDEVNIQSYSERLEHFKLGCVFLLEGIFKMRISSDSLHIRVCIKHMSDFFPVVLSAERACCVRY